MTTCRDIITRAMQESGIVALGETPTAAESSAGLTRLNAVIASAFGNSVGEGLSDLTLASSDEIDPNVRCVVTGRTAAITITLPEAPRNGARVQIIDADGTQWAKTGRRVCEPDAFDRGPEPDVALSRRPRGLGPGVGLDPERRPSVPVGA